MFRSLIPNRIAEQPARSAPAWRERPSSMSPLIWRLAWLASFVGHPVIIALPCFFGVCYKATPRWPDRLRWWAISCGLITLSPIIHIRWGVRTGRLSDHEISIRKERFRPLLVQMATVGGTYALLRALRAPRLVMALVLSISAAMIPITGITLYWKVSVHVAGTAGTVTVLSLVFGKRAYPLIALVPAVAWSRYILDHHSPAQGAVGALLGSLPPLLVFRSMDIRGDTIG
jgi:membrane-associated phospholipid phosphatase